MKKYFPFFLSIAFTSFSLASEVPLAYSYQEISLESEFKETLIRCYGIDSLIADQILTNVAPLFTSPDHHPVLKSFMNESENLKSSLDNLIQESSEIFSAYHAVLFENTSVRISWVVTKSGGEEPPQKHPWKTLMLIVNPSEFHSTQEDGSFYEDNWPIGTYVLEPSLDLLSCKNIGTKEYNALIIEVKASP